MNRSASIRQSSNYQSASASEGRAAGPPGQWRFKVSKLKGKVAVVTGASKGIGAGIAKALAAEGASVVVNYASSKDGAEKVVKAITGAGGKAVAVGGDVSKAGDAKKIIDAAIQNFGQLDILVNNSGVYEFQPIENVTEEHFHHIFNVNVLGFCSPPRKPRST